MAGSGRLVVSLVDAPPVLRFIGTIGEIADRASSVELSGVEVGAELNAALEKLASECNSMPEFPDAE